MSGAPPQFSPDGEWWWDGTAWIPAADAPEPRPVPPPGPPALPALGPLETSATTIVPEVSAPHPAASATVSFNRAELMLLGAGLLSFVGAFTPWVTIFRIGIGGVSINYGYVTLVSGALTTLLVLRLRKVPAGSTAMKRLAETALAAAVLSAAAAIYVGFAIRYSIGEDSSSSDSPLALSLADAFRPGIGYGLWIVLLAAVLTVLSVLPVRLQRPISNRKVLIPVAGLCVLALVGSVVAEQKQKSDRRHSIAVAKENEAAKEKAQADDEAAREKADADAQAAADAAEEADKLHFEVTLESCKKGQYGEITAVGTLVNTSEMSRSYEVTIEFLDGTKTRVDNGSDYVSDLGPSATARWSIEGFNSAAASCATPEAKVPF